MFCDFTNIIIFFFIFNAQFIFFFAHKSTIRLHLNATFLLIFICVK